MGVCKGHVLRGLRGKRPRYLWLLNMRRFLSILLLLAIVGATAWTLYKWNRTTTTAVDPWAALPARSAVVIEIPDAWSTWDKFTHTSQLWATAEAIPSAAAMGRLMARTMERAENDAALRSALTDVPVFVSVTRTGSEQIDLLFACVPRAANGVPLQAFGELLKADDASIAAIQRGEVVQVKPDSSLPALSLSVQQGLWLLATSPTMMDEALLQLKSSESLAKDSLLSAARKSLGGGSDAHVLVHIERARALLHRWWTPAMIDALDLPTGWAALDVRARPDAFLLSGLLFADAPDRAMVAMSEQGVGRNDLARWMPATVNAWQVQEVSDADRFLKDLGLVDPDTAANVNELFRWVNGNIGRASVLDSTAAATTQWTYFQTDDVESAIEGLNSLCPTGTCDTASYRGTRIVHLPLYNTYERLLGDAYADLQQPWWCVLNDVVVFSAKQQNLLTVIDAWNDGRTLAEDRRTNTWTDRIASSAGHTLRWDVARAANGFSQGMKDDARSELRAHNDILARLGGLSIQLSPAQHGRVHLAIGLQHAPLEERATGIHWSTPIPTGVTRKPDVLRNHNTGTREVLVQDGEHRIHLLGSTGKKLWSYALDGPILGEVHQVDRFRNGKLQILLNTADRLYLIDRNGKDVGGFPAKFPVKATAPIAVFDYDAQRDYRILVPVADGRLLNYGLEGTPVTGWEEPRLAAPVTNSAVHLRIKNKDYLLVVDGLGKVYLLDRRGAERDKTSLELGAASTLLSVQPGLELMSTELLWTDSSGGVWSAGLNSKPSSVASAQLGWIGVGSLGQDGHNDLIRVVNDSVIVSHAGKVLLTLSFGAPLLPGAWPYQLEKGTTTYGLMIPEREQVTLINGAGMELDGMPLRGATPLSIADLDLDGTMELITVTSDGHVVAYHALPASTEAR